MKPDNTPVPRYEYDRVCAESAILNEKIKELKIANSRLMDALADALNRAAKDEKENE